MLSRYSRVLIRALRLLAVTLASSATVLAAKLLTPLVPALYPKARNRALNFWGASFCRAARMRVTILGPRPRGRFLLISNHLSYTDIPLLAAHLETTFVAKADLGQWPLLGRIFRLAGTIFIDRGRKRDVLRVMDSVGDQLRNGGGVVIFAEGTSGRGDEILRLKPSLLELPAKEKEPVYYATINYRTPEDCPAASDSVCWWDGTHFIVHFLRLLSLPGFEATLVFGKRPIIDQDRKALAERLRAAMLEDFQPSAPPQNLPAD